MSSNSSKAVAFFGATGGCGLAALKKSLAAGYTCIALCRTPSRLTSQLSTDEQSKLHIKQGNAHDVDAVAKCLVDPNKPDSLVDSIIFSIGGVFSFTRLNIDDPNVCEKGIVAVLDALKKLRQSGGFTGQSPLVIGVSSTGISRLGRDLPYLMKPLYALLWRPHADKEAMENRLIESNEVWTIVRPSLLLDGPESDKPIREGIEDPKARKVESVAIGYTISRNDVGKWIFNNLINRDSDKWVKKVATITY